MGTNYYAITEGCESACEHCSESKEIHLGKSSAGWKFLFKCNDSRETALFDWLDTVDKAIQIKDQYGEVISKESLFRKVILKQAAAHSQLNPIDNEKFAWTLDHVFEKGGFVFCDREFS
jgi:hypothetical protein